VSKKQGKARKRQKYLSKKGARENVKLSSELGRITGKGGEMGYKSSRGRVKKVKIQVWSHSERNLEELGGYYRFHLMISLRGGAAEKGSP